MSRFEISRREKQSVTWKLPDVLACSSLMLVLTPTTLSVSSPTLSVLLAWDIMFNIIIISSLTCLPLLPRRRPRPRPRPAGSSSRAVSVQCQLSVYVIVNCLLQHDFRIFVIYGSFQFPISHIHVIFKEKNCV